MTGRGVALVVGTVCVVAMVPDIELGGAALQARGGQPPPAPRAVLQQYCVTCHNQRTRAGGLALDTLDMTQAGECADVWERVVRKLRTGAMPPAGRPRPDEAESNAVVTWLETELDRAAQEHPNPGRPTLHRLNRSEYRNAIRDLLAVDIDASLLPADNAAYGFDNNADALTLSSALTERYLGAAAKISQMALGRSRGSPTPETIFVPTDRDQDGRVSDDLPFGSRGGTAFRYYFPADGDYLFEMRPRGNGVAGGFQGVTDEPHQLDVSLDDVRVWTGTVQRPEGVRGDERNKQILESMQFRVPVTAGAHLVQVYFVAKTSAYVEDLFDPDLRRDPYRAGNGEPAISSVTITGPQPETASLGESLSPPQAAGLHAGLGRDGDRKRSVCQDYPVDARETCLSAPDHRPRPGHSDRLVSRWRESGGGSKRVSSWRCAAFSSVRIFCSDSSSSRRRSRPIRPIASRISSWHRASRSSCGAASRMTSWWRWL